jgi:hypothetical protein
LFGFALSLGYQLWRVFPVGLGNVSGNALDWHIMVLCAGRVLLVVTQVFDLAAWGSYLYSYSHS